MGVLAPMVDMAAGSASRRHLTNAWQVTSDMWLHEVAPLDPEGGGPIEVVAWDMRIGGRSMVFGCDVTQVGREVATASLEFTRIRREASPYEKRPIGTSGKPVAVGSGPLMDRPLGEVMRFETGEGAVRLTRHDEVTNSIGTIQGGAIAMLADAAAVDHVGSGRVVDLHFRFLGQTGAGPAIATCRTIRSDATSSTVSVEIVDSSAEDTVVGWAIVRLEDIASGNTMEEAQ